jgi:hypothetical protein
MCNRTPENQKAMDYFDEQVKKHGSLEKWLEYRLANEPGFTVETELIPYGQLPQRLAAQQA